MIGPIPVGSTWRSLQKRRLRKVVGFTPDGRIVSLPVPSWEGNQTVSTVESWVRNYERERAR